MRAIGVFGTLLLTRFLAPSEYGSVSVAVTLVMTANILSCVGLGQYIASRPSHDPRVAFHAALVHVGLGVVALTIVWAFRHRLASLVHAPEAAGYVAPLCLGFVGERLSYVPERVLLQRMRFREVSLARSAGVLAYTVGSVVLALLGLGGAAIVWGNFARFAVKLLVVSLYTDRRDWLAMVGIDPAILRAMFRYGLPLSVGGFSTYITSNWDNLLVSRWFGPDALGAYNLAYNLADTPATQIAEQAGDVLVPSYAQQERAARRRGFVRSLLALSMLVTPLGVGLGLVAPTLVSAVLDPRWASAAPMLTILAVLSVVRPPIWTGAAYLMSTDRTRLALLVEMGKVTFLTAALFLVGQRSPEWVCVAIGIGFAGTAILSLLVIRYVDGFSLREIALAELSPVAPAIGMMGMVLLVRRVADTVHVPIVARLVLEIAGGAVAYVIGALVLAPAASRNLLDGVKAAFLKRRAVPDSRAASDGQATKALAQAEQSDDGAEEPEVSRVSTR